MASHQVKNVKIHFKAKLSAEIPSTLKGNCKSHSNFITVRIKPYVCTIFQKSGHVNMSGIPNFEKINQALSLFNSHFFTNIREEDIVVDNSTTSGNLSISEKNIPLDKLNGNSDKVTVFIRPHFFHSAVIRPGKSADHRGTVVLFSNGKYFIVGCKSVPDITETVSQLCALTKTL